MKQKVLEREQFGASEFTEPFEWEPHILEILDSCLEEDPTKRFSLEQIEQHPYLTELYEAEEKAMRLEWQDRANRLEKRAQARQRKRNRLFYDQKHHPDEAPPLKNLVF